MLALFRLPLRFVGMFVVAVNSRGRAFEGAFWFGVVFVVLASAGVFLAFLRRRLRRSDDRGAMGFTLDELRRMRSRGELSDEEFKSLQRRAVDSFGGSKNT